MRLKRHPKSERYAEPGQATRNQSGGGGRTYSTKGSINPVVADEIKIKVEDTIQKISDEYGVKIIPSRPEREQKMFLYGVVTESVAVIIAVVAVLPI